MHANKLDLLVISDLHAHAGDPEKSDAPSFLSTNALYDAPTINPMTAIPDLIRKEGLRADWVISPGDLGDKAQPAPQAFAWTSLSRIRDELGATHLIGTTGNHDIDSRRAFPNYDP